MNQTSFVHVPVLNCHKFFIISLRHPLPAPQLLKFGLLYEKIRYFFSQEFLTNLNPLDFQITSISHNKFIDFSKAEIWVSDKFEKAFKGPTATARRSRPIKDHF